MGTPHCKDENMALWQRSLFILKAQLRSVSDKCLNTADIAMLANVCRLFESIDLQCPILSVFETRVTKISRRLRAPKKIIVG